MTPAGSSWVADAAERVCWTAVQAFGGALIDISTHHDHLSWRAAGYAVGLSVVKTVAARYSPPKTDASTLGALQELVARLTRPATAAKPPARASK